MPKQRQSLLFSATMPGNLDDLARMSLRTPGLVRVAKSATPAAGVRQTLHHTAPEEKTRLLLALLKDQDESVLVFTRTKHRADRLGQILEQVGHRVAVLHGDRRLSQRRLALEGFRRGRYRILVATNIAARGLDVAHIGHVINYDLPRTPEDYVHRIGRTGRMKALRRATSFATIEDARYIRAIERLLGYPVPRAAGSVFHPLPAPPTCFPGGSTPPASPLRVGTDRKNFKKD